MKKTIWIELVCFMLLFGILYRGASSVLGYKDTGNGGGFRNLYSLNRESADVMIFGSSHSSATIDNSLLWNDKGIASFTLSAGGQTGDATYYFMREAFKRQTPAVALIETVNLYTPEVQGGAYVLDTTLGYRTNLTMNTSGTYLPQILEQARNYDLSREATENLAFRMPIIHSRYSELTSSDYYNTTPNMVGFKGSYWTTPSENPVVTDEKYFISDLAISYIDQIIQLCKEKGITPVFFCAPYPRSEVDAQRQKALADIFADRNVTYLDFNQTDLFEETGLNFQTDISDGDHLNTLGADKVTAWMENYLTEQFDLPDRRGQKGYERWDAHLAYQERRADQNRLQSETGLTEYLEELGKCYGDLDVVIALNGNYNAAGNFYQEALAGLGIDQASYEKGGLFVLRKGSFVFYSEGMDSYDFHLDAGHRTIYVRNGQPTADGLTTALVNVDLQEMNVPENGISITVLDEDTEKILDQVSCNVYESTDVTRNTDVIDFE